MKDIIESGKTALGIEFGSTKIKAVLIDENNNLIATRVTNGKINMKTVYGHTALMIFGQDFRTATANLLQQ